jgi:hypothetical protein
MFETLKNIIEGDKLEGVRVPVASDYHVVSAQRERERDEMESVNGTINSGSVEESGFLYRRLLA